MKRIKNHTNTYYNKVIALPKYLRISIGIIFVLLGCVGFLPVIGFWMIPLGLMILAVDFKFAKRWHIKLKYQWRAIKRRFKKHANK